MPKIILSEEVLRSHNLYTQIMKKLILLFLSVCLSAGLFGQYKLSGVVFDGFTNSPMQNVKISMNGKQLATTDSNGKFSIDCVQNRQLVFSIDGYKDYTETVSNCDNAMNVGMSSLTQDLNTVDVNLIIKDNKDLLVQPLSVVKMEELEIKRGTGLYLNDAINTNVPGVYMSSRANSSGQQFNIRGYGNGSRGTRGISSNFDGQGSKVYLNGILITDAEGVTVMDDIDFGSIGSVNVLMGPSGTLYGQAISGVVQLETKRAARNSSSISEDILFGSYGLMRSTTRLELGGKNSSIMVNYGKQKFDGFMPHTAAHKDFVNFIGDFDINKKQSLTTYVGFSDSYDQRNGELTIGQYDTLDYSGNSAYIKNDAHSAVKTLRAGFAHVYKFDEHVSNTTSLFGSSTYLNNSSAGGWSDKSNMNYGLRSTVDMNWNLGKSVRLVGVVGGELQKTNALTTGYSMGADSTDLSGYNVIKSIRSTQETYSSTGNVFTQWTVKLPKDFSVTAGVGYSYLNLGLSDRLWGLTNNHPGAITPQSYSASYNDMVSPSASIQKIFSKSVTAYVSYSVGYKAPVSSYFFIPQTGEVNLGLKPEKGVQLEIGTKGSLLKDKLYYTVAVFNTQYQNKMTTVTVQNPSNTATLYSYLKNGGTVNNNGLEVLLKYSVIDNGKGFFTAVRPFANFTYSDFKYEDFRFETIGKNGANQDSAIVTDFSGNQVAGVPKIVANIGVDVETKIGVYGNLTVNYRDAMYITSDEVFKTNSYTLLNAKFGYRKTISKFTFDAYFGLNNITSTQYYYMVFVNQIPDAYIAAPNEINFFGGVNLKYRF